MIHKEDGVLPCCFTFLSMSPLPSGPAASLMAEKRCVSSPWWCELGVCGPEEAVGYESGVVGGGHVGRLEVDGVEAADEAVVEDDHPGGGCGAFGGFRALGNGISGALCLGRRQWVWMLGCHVRILLGLERSLECA